MAGDMRLLRFETLAVHGGEREPAPEGSLVYPIYQGTVYAVAPGTAYQDIAYIRLSTTPSQRYLHDKLAALEGAEAAVATASGMAAMTSILLASLEQGDHLLAADCLYGGTYAFLRHEAPRLGWAVTFVNPGRPDSWKAALHPRTRLFLCESITNPLVRVPLLDQIAAFAREHGLVSVVDNTFATPLNLRPLELGFDLVFHSATKYLNGHSDLVAGCVAGRADRLQSVRRTLSRYGGCLDPHAGFLLARGLKTLALRVRAQNGNAMVLSRYLAGHPRVVATHYPGLESHPDHDHARGFLHGFGGMLSFAPEGGPEAAERILSTLRIPYHAPSLGGVETLVTRPAATSHASLTREERARMGIGDDLIRVSCGIESAEDLVEDFAIALGRG